jgi:ribonuclease HI
MDRFAMKDKKLASCLFHQATPPSTSSRLKTYFTNNQAEYEALLFGLELLNCMGVKHVKAFGDSQLVVQHVLEEYQCLDGTLNSYLEKYWGIIHSFDEFSIRHISRVENCRANNLA